MQKLIKFNWYARWSVHAVPQEVSDSIPNSDTEDPNVCSEGCPKDPVGYSGVPMTPMDCRGRDDSHYVLLVDVLRKWHWNS